MLKGWMSLCLVLGIGVAGLPAEASEVVKLARLVVSGKRSAPEAPRATTPEPRSTGNASQAHGSGSGGPDEPGLAPSPARGVS